MFQYAALTEPKRESPYTAALVLAHGSVRRVVIAALYEPVWLKLSVSLWYLAAFSYSSFIMTSDKAQHASLNSATIGSGLRLTTVMWGHLKKLLSPSAPCHTLPDSSIVPNQLGRTLAFMCALNSASGPSMNQ